jgi:uroporphyrinogen III methyltransferase/synthase
MPDEPDASRILVPRSRAGANVLADALRAKGADVVEFPALDVAPPSDLPALDAAARDVSAYAWILVSGEHSARTLLARLEAAGSDATADFGGRLVALGTGTVGALRAHGIRPAFAPREHRPEAVLEVMGPVAGERVLLVREQTAEGALPDALRRAGAEVSDVAGYRLEVRVDDEVVRRAFDPRPDVVALPNPTAARVLRRALSAAGSAASIEGVPVWAVGPSTAEAAERYGFRVDHVSGGRLKHLVRDLTAGIG